MGGASSTAFTKNGASPDHAPDVNGSAARARQKASAFSGSAGATTQGVSMRRMFVPSGSPVTNAISDCADASA